MKKEDKKVIVKSRKTKFGWVSVVTKDGQTAVFPAKTQKETIRNISRFFT